MKSILIILTLFLAQFSYSQENIFNPGDWFFEDVEIKEETISSEHYNSTLSKNYITPGMTKKNIRIGDPTYIQKQEFIAYISWKRTKPDYTLVVKVKWAYECVDIYTAIESVCHQKVEHFDISQNSMPMGIAVFKGDETIIAHDDKWPQDISAEEKAKVFEYLNLHNLLLQYKEANVYQKISSLIHE